MSKKTVMSVAIGLALVAGLAFVGWIASSNAVAQNAKTGEWTASMANKDSGKDTGKDANKIHLNFEQRSNKGGRNQMGQSYDFADLQGLSREQVLAGGPVKFSLVREAEELTAKAAFKQRFRTFSFQEIRILYSHEKSGLRLRRVQSKRRTRSEDRLFAATTLNVTRLWLMTRLNGLCKLGVDDLSRRRSLRSIRTLCVR
jgi:hypothetical protein